jgi:hypothetical protein
MRVMRGGELREHPAAIGCNDRLQVGPRIPATPAGVRSGRVSPARTTVSVCAIGSSRSVRARRRRG